MDPTKVLCRDRHVGNVRHLRPTRALTAQAAESYAVQDACRSLMMRLGSTSRSSREVAFEDFGFEQR